MKTIVIYHNNQKKLFNNFVCNFLTIINKKKTRLKRLKLYSAQKTVLYTFTKLNEFKDTLKFPIKS